MKRHGHDVREPSRRSPNPRAKKSHEKNEDTGWPDWCLDKYGEEYLKDYDLGFGNMEDDTQSQGNDQSTSQCIPYVAIHILLIHFLFLSVILKLVFNPNQSLSVLLIQSERREKARKSANSGFPNGELSAEHPPSRRSMSNVRTLRITPVSKAIVGGHIGLL